MYIKQSINLVDGNNSKRKTFTFANRAVFKELDHLHKLGIRNLRVLVASEADQQMKFAIHPALQNGPGEYNEDLWKGLDFLLVEMAKREMTATMVLGNFWPCFLRCISRSVIGRPPRYAEYSLKLKGIDSDGKA